MGKEPIFTGCATALLTPMKADGSIHYEKAAELIERQIENGIDALVAVGTTGEAATLQDEERTELIAFTVRQVKGRVPVIAGTGANDTSRAVALTKAAEKAGADGILSVTPYYNKASQKGLFQHFKTVAKATKLPMILYNIPSRTGCNILPETALRLADTENIVGLKEACDQISQVARTAALCGDNLPLYAGHDDQVTAIFALGGVGVISAAANLCPKEMANICHTWARGETKKAVEAQLALMPILDALSLDINPIPLKQAMNYLNYEVGECRMPLCEMEDASAIKLLNTLKKYFK